MKILIIGALGTVGRRLVPELLKLGHDVAISSRDPNKPSPWSDQKTSRFTLDLLKPETIEPAIQGVNVIYYLMHGMSDGERHTPRELYAARNLVEAAEKAGVAHIIYLGSLLSEQPSSEHMQARQATGRILTSGSVAVTELRAGIIIAPGSAAFEVMRDMVGHLPFALVPPAIDNLMPPIAIQDVVFYLVGLLQHPPKYAQVLEATGPEWLSYRQMLMQLGRRLDHRCMLLTVPALPLRWLGGALRVVTSVPTSLAKALAAGLAEPLTADPKPLQALLPRELMSYEQALNSVFAEEQILAQPSQWLEHAPLFRNFSARHAFYAKSAKHTIEIPVAARFVWQVLNRLGGKERYFFLDSLWALREWMDWLVGGPGREHGRSCEDEFRVGERVDSWTILTVEEERLLVMKFCMKAPGGGGMQIRIEPDSPASCSLSIELLWHPAGFWGLAYWYFFAPWHRLLLTGMSRNIMKLSWDLAHGVNLQEE